MTEPSTPPQSSTASSLGLSEDFVRILVCPIDHSHLTIAEKGLVCDKCGRTYPVDNGIPNFVVEE